MNLAGNELNDRDLIERVMKNMRRATKGTLHEQRWVVVRATFGVGSSVAYALCHEFKLNPEDILK